MPLRRVVLLLLLPLRTARARTAAVLLLVPATVACEEIILDYGTDWATLFTVVKNTQID